MHDSKVKSVSTRKVSIIIPAYNRAAMIGITIESFVAQNYPNEDYEIIIADNNSSDNTREVVEEWIAKSDVQIKYLFEKRQGVHYARNSAAKVAAGEILYYTDDDMVADKNLLKNLLKVFDGKNNVASASGKVLPKWEVEPPKWILKYCYNGWLSLNDRPEDLIISHDDPGVYSCHQAILREVFFKAGGFNPENTAGEWVGDGETGLNIKIKEMGYCFAYVGNSVIYHMIPSERMTQSYINKRLGNQGNCDSYTAYRKTHYGRGELYRQILFFLIKFLRRLFSCIKKLILSRDAWRMDRAYMSYCVSRMKYDYRLTMDEEWRKMVLKNDWLNE